MNPVSLASSGLLTQPSGSDDVNAAVPSLVTASGSEGQTEFSLPHTALSTLTERVKVLKAAHQAAETNRSQAQDDDPNAMQALMSLLLSHSEHQWPNTAGNFAGNVPVQQTIVQLQAANAMPGGLRQLLANVQDKVGQAISDTADQQAEQLSPKLQSVLSMLSSDSVAQQGTVDQQAKLAQFSAENLQSIAPQQTATAHVSRMLTPQTERTPVRSMLAANKVDNTRRLQTSVLLSSLNTPQPQNLRPSLDNTATPFTAVLPADTQSDEWGDKLTNLLQERIQFQISQQQQTSTIRLDPPSLGKLEIAVQLDAGKLMVHIGASQSDVFHALQQFSDGLRQHLTEQNFVQVDVHVSDDGQSQQQRQQQQQEENVSSALMLEDEQPAARHESVLIKV